MKKMSLLQIAISGLGAILLLFWGRQYDALSYGIGGLISLFSFFSWGLGMSFLFQKKFIALSISIIVFKYAILGVIIYWLLQQGWLSPLWLSLGVASLAATALIYACLEALKEGKRNGI